jgi:hypothetical protein
MAFIVRPIPQPGETLNSLLIRLAHENGLSSIGDVVESIGINRASTLYLPFTSTGKTGRLAKLIGIPKTEVDALMYPEFVGEGSATLVMHHGMPMRRHFLDGPYRRLSSASLRKSVYHRASWDIRLLPFCPESFELLHSACPSCNLPISWRAPLNLCHRCSCDFRFATSEVISDGDREIATWGSALASVDPATRHKAWSQLDPSFATLGSVAVFDLIAMFGALDDDPTEERSRKILRGLRSGDFRGWTASMFISGSRIIRDWPNGFFQLVAKLAESAPKRNRGRGRFYQLGVLAQLADVKAHNRVFANYFRPFIEDALARAENQELAGQPVTATATSVITPEEIQERFGICRPTITKWSKALGMAAGRELSRGRRVGLNREQFERLMEMRENILPNIETCNSISRRTRFPIPALVYLTQKGLCADAGEELRVLRGVTLPVFYKGAVDEAFINKIRENQSKATNQIALGNALNFAGFFADGWAEALEAVLSGKLPATLSPDTSVKLAYRIVVDACALDTLLEDVAAAAPEHVPLALAASIVKVEYSTLIDAVAAGFLEGHGSSKKFTTMPDIVKFKREFVTCRQLSVLFGVSLHAVSLTLKKSMVKSVLPEQPDRQLIYRRSSTTQVIEAAICGPRQRRWRRYA